MNKKDMIIVALATFCLTSTLFMILPSRSAERDPWADVSGPTIGEPDGTINMRDINYEIQHFNQDVSNMTRNVNVTNWQLQLPEPNYRIDNYYVNISWNSGPGSTIVTGETGGYSRMATQISVYYWWPNSAGTTSFWADKVWWMIDDFGGQWFTELENLNSTVGSIHMSNPYQGETCQSTMIETQGPIYNLFIGYNSSISTGWMLAKVSVYLRNE